MPIKYDENVYEKENIKMSDTLQEKLDFDGITSDGFTIRSGNKLLKLTITETKSIIDDEKDFRKELEEKFVETYNKTLENVKMFLEKIKNETDEKEKELNEKLKNAYIMPSISFDDAKNGVSIVRGATGQLIWLVRGVYSVKFVDGKPLDPKITRRTTTDVIYMIVTSGNKMIKISTCKPISLEYFDHYHQTNPDCWGDWWKDRVNNVFKKPDDIIKLAREAEAVLENVNIGSIAKENPTALPRLSTLKKYILEDKKPSDIKELKHNLENQRVGLNEHNQHRYTWSTTGR